MYCNQAYFNTIEERDVYLKGMIDAFTGLITEMKTYGSRNVSIEEIQTFSVNLRKAVQNAKIGKDECGAV